METRCKSQKSRIFVVDFNFQYERISWDYFIIIIPKINPSILNKNHILLILNYLQINYLVVVYNLTSIKQVPHFDEVSSAEFLLPTADFSELKKSFYKIFFVASLSTIFWVRLNEFFLKVRNIEKRFKSYQQIYYAMGR